MHDEDIPFNRARGNEDAEREELALENLDITIEAMWRIHGEINEWSRGADIKAGIVLAANGAFVAGVAVALSTGSFLPIVHERQLAGAFLLVSLVAIVISSVYAALCLVPPLRVGEVESLLSPDYIARHFSTGTAYENAVRRTLADAECNLVEISHQVWTVANRLWRKLHYATWGIRFLIASLFFGLMTLLVAFL